jgi:hypothetical protein
MALAARLLDLTKPPELDRYNPKPFVVCRFCGHGGWIRIIDKREAKKLADRILIALVDWYYENGYKSDHYSNPVTGGIYEHRLASIMGVPNVSTSYEGGTTNVPSPLFLAATDILAKDGYVKRLQRKPDYPVMGLQHTKIGLKRVEYLKSRWLYRTKKLKSNWSNKAYNWYVKHWHELIYAIFFAILFAFLIERIKK